MRPPVPVPVIAQLDRAIFFTKSSSPNLLCGTAKITAYHGLNLVIMQFMNDINDFGISDIENEENLFIVEGYNAIIFMKCR
jgi:hypothetical protein